MSSHTDIILAMESAIAGGSISLYRNDAELASWTGSATISKAEELLPNIDRILKTSSLSICNVNRLIVSVGPGSYTGIRVGIATAMGFRASLRIPCFGISALHALSASVEHPNKVAAVPMGRGMICMQNFRSTDHASPPLIQTAEQFVETVERAASETIVILHQQLFDEHAVRIGSKVKVLNAGPNVAKHLCEAADSPFMSTDLVPLFVERTATIS